MRYPVEGCCPLRFVGVLIIPSECLWSEGVCPHGARRASGGEVEMSVPLAGERRSSRKCFLARPISLSAEGATRYRGDREHWTHVEQLLIEPALKSAGFELVSPAAQGAILIHEHVISSLDEADLVVADFSGLNANVLFEAGVRTAINKPLVIVAEEGTALPFDTAGINTYFYNPELNAWDLPQAVDRLSEHISQGATEGNALWRKFGVQLRAEALANEGDPTQQVLELISSELQDLRREQHQMRREFARGAPGARRRRPVGAREIETVGPELAARMNVLEFSRSIMKAVEMRGAKDGATETLPDLLSRLRHPAVDRGSGEFQAVLMEIRDILAVEGLEGVFDDALVASIRPRPDRL